MNRYPPASPGSSIFPRRDIFRKLDFRNRWFWVSKWERRIGSDQNSSLMAVLKPEETPFDSRDNHPVLSFEGPKPIETR